jgi:hypothetical protein
LLGFLLSLPYRSKKNKAIKFRDKKIKELEEKVEQLKRGISKPLDEH